MKSQAMVIAVLIIVGLGAIFLPGKNLMRHNHGGCEGNQALYLNAVDQCMHERGCDITVNEYMRHDALVEICEEARKQ